ncbi:YL1-domain-containing protein [Daldinia vernicosa]|uniref:YL1-domain-containing protein n=1 Tax=Daldinia vernicosa TaxID=114800 RepID=UPI0020089154|nr:YL1-domain-containing protein [Daldinia vernicosa]KAI0850988.1 YL1-domain-containing protein [Daldinia vernicosa]
MAEEEDEQRAQTSDNDLDLDKTDSSSEDGGSGDEDESPRVEWLATGREKRSTAGNRMKSMIAAEEPDDDLELLFAEDEDDAGFTDVEDDGSDVQMESSSDEEDAQENGDELEGEKELEKRARESKQAARKRKAQEAIPIKFRKKVKIAPTPSGSSMAPEPKPRPKKKSERISWLPSPADMPTRASKRETTMLSKEQLHQQMIEREVKRLKQVEAMEKKAKKMEALKKPPMTQAQRLAEAVIVEKKNSKSLNRWEEAEKQREEERRAKLAALNNRTLDGPVVTFWSGVGEWVDGKLKHVGKIVTIEEKPAKKKRASIAGHEIPTDPPSTEELGKPKESGPTNVDKAENKEPGPTSTEISKAKESEVKDGFTPSPTVSKEPITDGDKPLPASGPTTAPAQAAPVTVPSAPPAVPDQSPKDTIPSPPAASLSEPPPRPQEPKPSEAKISEMKAPDMRPPVTGIYTTSVFAPPQPSQLMKPPELKPPSNSFLAPPAGITQGGLSMPMIGYHSTPNTTNPSNVLAPPNTAQRQSPLSMPQTGACPPPMSTPTHPIQPLTQPGPTPAPIPTTPTPKPTPTTSSIPTSSLPSTPAQISTPTPAQKSTSVARYTSKTPLSTTKSSKANNQRHQPKEVPPPPPPSPPANGKATRNCIILQNFNENAIKEKAVQNQILFGKDMAKLSKPTPAPRCVITNHPARYKDPKTGLPYYNAYAFREIQKLWRGEYRWSRLAGAWMGSGSYAATGVPARFLNPDAPGPQKKTETTEGPKEDAPGPNKDAVPGVLATPAAPIASTEPKEPASITNTVPPPVATTPNPPMTEARASAPVDSSPARAPPQAGVLATPSDSTPVTMAPPTTLDASPEAVPSTHPTPLAPPAPISATNVTPMAIGDHVNSEM